MTSMPGRIDRSALPRTTTPIAQSAAASAAKAVESAKSVVADLTARATQFAHEQLGPQSLGTATVGGHVAQTASPDALWSQPTALPANVADLSKLSRTEKIEKAKVLVAERDQLGGKIQDRVAYLDQKWDRSRSQTQAQALRVFLAENGTKLPAEKRADLEGKLAAFDATQAKFDAALAKAKTMPKRSECKTPEQIEARHQMAVELVAMHRAMGDIADAAASIADGCGSKGDRLASGEQIIDKSAPPKGSAQCLASMVSHFFELTQQIYYLQSSSRLEVDPVLQQLKQQGESEAKLWEEMRERFKKQDAKVEKLRDAEAIDRARIEAMLKRT